MTNLLLLAAFVVIPITSFDLLLRALARKKPHWLYTPPETETTMTALTDQLVAKHRPTMTQEKCLCEWQGFGMFALGRHLIEVGVQAGREDAR